MCNLGGGSTPPLRNLSMRYATYARVFTRSRDAARPPTRGAQFWLQGQACTSGMFMFSANYYASWYTRCCASSSDSGSSSTNTQWNTYRLVPWLKVAINCNCGTRIAQFASGYETTQKCQAQCEANNGCRSFGLWTEQDQGYCALFGTACTSQCPQPTSAADGFKNNVFNKPSKTRTRMRSRALARTRVHTHTHTRTHATARDSTRAQEHAHTAARIHAHTHGVWSDTTGFVSLRTSICTEALQLNS